MFQLAILQDAMPSGGGYVVMVILLGALSGALVAVFQTLFTRLAHRRDAGGPVQGPRPPAGTLSGPGGALPTPSVTGPGG